MRAALTVGIAVVLLTAALSCWGQAARTVELREGLASGELWAQLHGAGDSQVVGAIGRTGTEPLIATLDAGTLYLAQASGQSQQGGRQAQGGGSSRQGQSGGGRQGQIGLSSLSVDLTTTAVAQVVIPSACTNFGLHEPTPDDVMVPTVCPDVRLARLVNLPEVPTAPHAAVQLAVWAITDNPRPVRVRGYLWNMSAQGKAADLVGRAGELLAACGLEPRDFRLFR